MDKVYKIGDTGPAGGIVFYDRGFTEDGWRRYMEAAPAGKEFKAKWGSNMNVAGTESTVGSGKRNTQLIIAALGEKGQAAYLCANLNFNGYKDWFLPSLDEFGLMYNSLVRMGLGGFTTECYWSSSQYKDYGSAAWYRKGGDGGQGYDDVYSTLYVRAVRAF
ncbi:MAG: DUF1566 domain-containing protein [Treponema sp.]|jgi:hypothetical protein|nr:DUF1566 domain-containing protein [Treponema sp.]